MSAEFKKFETAVKAVIRRANKYASTGGDETESSMNRKEEMALFKAGDRLYDSMRKLGLSDDPKAEALLADARKAVRAAPEQASQRRQEIRREEIKKLDEKAAEHRRWRIENGLEDPPRY